jgi:hypothetical protein
MILDFGQSFKRTVSDLLRVYLSFRDSIKSGQDHIEDGDASKEIFLFQASPLLSFEPWHYFQLLERFGEVCRYLLPEKLRLAFSQRLIGDEAPFPFASVSKATRARVQQLVLFHALFVQWPKHWSTVLTTIQQFTRELAAGNCHVELAQCEQLLHVLTRDQNDPPYEIASGLERLLELWTQIAQQNALTYSCEALFPPMRHRLMTWLDS